MTEFKLAIRTCLKTPWISLVIIVTLVLGIGINLAVFVFFNALFLSPLPAIHDQARVVIGYSRLANSREFFPISFANYQDLRRQVKSLENLAAYQTIQVGVMGEERAEQIAGEVVTPAYFSALGVQPTLGQFFRSEDNELAGPRDQVVLSHRFWQRRLGGDPSVLGKRVIINGKPFTVVAVAAPGFHGTNLFLRDELWLPMSSYRDVSLAPNLLEQRSGQAFQMVGHLKPGISVQAATAEMNALMQRLVEAFPDDNRGQSPVLLPLAEAAISPDSRQGYVSAVLLAFLAGGTLLFLAVVNVGHLLMARALARVRESFIRTMLGASRSQLIWHLTAEGVLLAFLGGGLSLLLAVWTRDLLWYFRPPVFDTSLLEIGLGSRAFLFAFTITVLIALAFAGTLGWKISRAESLRQFTFAVLDCTPVRRRRTSDALVMLQISLCTLAVAAGTLIGWELWRAQEIDPGFSAEGLVSLSTDLRSAGLPAEKWPATRRALTDRLRALPGVEAVGVSEDRLMGGFRLWRKLTRADRVAAVADRPLIGSTSVGAGYFHAVNIPLRAGREFIESDDECRCVVVNQALARLLWDGESAVGSYLLIDEDPTIFQVIGVVGNTKLRRLDEPSQAFLYLFAGRQPNRRATFTVKMRNAALVSPVTIEEAVRDVSPSLPIIKLEVVNESIQRSLWLPRFLAVICLVLGAFGLLLTVIGIYGLVAYRLSQQSRDLAIRIVLGETPHGLIRKLTFQGMRTALLGTMLGILGAASISGWLKSFFLSAPVCVGALLFVALLLTFVASLAYLAPGFRLTTLNPASILKDGG